MWPAGRRSHTTLASTISLHTRAVLVLRGALLPQTHAMSSRTCLIEEAPVQALLDALLRVPHAPAQVGLLLGKLEVTSSRDFILALVRTPEKPGAGDDDDGDDDGQLSRSSTRGSIPGGLIEVDEDWIVEHATQVARMLPGGLAVVGVFAFASDAAWRAASPALCRAAVEVGIACGGGSIGGSMDADAADRSCLVLHLSSSTRKVSLRRCGTVAGSGPTSALPAPTPVEFKLGSVLKNMVRVDATYDVDAVLTGRGGNLRAAAEELIASEASRVESAEVLLGGRLRHPDDPMAAVVDKTQATETQATAAGEMPPQATPRVTARLLCPPRCAAVKAKVSGSIPAGVVTGQSEGTWFEARVRGVLAVRAYVYARESARRAAADLRADVIATLRARIDLLLDEADREAEGGNETAAGSSAHALAEGAPPPPGAISVGLPRRSWVRWMDGCEVCDYLAEGESAEDAVERCREVLDWEVPGGAAGTADAEAAAPAAVCRGGGGAGVKGNDGTWRGEGAVSGKPVGSSSSTSVRNYALGAGLAIVTAALSIVALDELDIYDFY